jgi:hypothetical protein
MQSSAEGHLHRFQIGLAGMLALGEDTGKQRGYLARDLVLDCLGRFFSCSLKAGSATGRRRQIFSFTSRKARLSS